MSSSSTTGGLAPLQDAERRDVLEILEDPYSVRSQCAPDRAIKRAPRRHEAKLDG
jgi:hypothetical protein